MDTVWSSSRHGVPVTAAGRAPCRKVILSFGDLFTMETRVYKRSSVVLFTSYQRHSGYHAKPE